MQQDFQQNSPFKKNQKNIMVISDYQVVVYGREARLTPTALEDIA